ncbi:hypothetical protein FQN51_008885 [Onygenales sp. PD_10]|nr:hypothetical protein FQN51_008885 [Onygenales sp. PD_10]
MSEHRKQPRAEFGPISPDLDLAALVESSPNFEFVVRVPLESIEEQGIAKFEKLVLLHVILGGKPLVIEGYQDWLEKWIFGLQWLRDNHGAKVENARDLTTKKYVPLHVNHYLNSMPLLTDQWTATNYKDPRQRLYLKDIDCPPVWSDKLKDLLPSFLYYLNESTKGDGYSRAGDLMSSLPPDMRAENLMCYIGHEGTYTPAHREMCATLGHNIMVEASTGSIEDGKPTKPGSSIWFMTETSDREAVSEYWRYTLGHDIEIENYFAQINALKKAPFKTWVVEQKVGDFILIPPLAPHQVWNRGTRTMKVAWNRTTVETLEMAMKEALPKARMVCRDEQYKNKAIVYFTLMKYSRILYDAADTPNLGIRQLRRDFKRLFSLYTDILLSECFSRDMSEPKNVEYLPFTSNVTCSYCRCNIFNRFLTCPSCVGKLPDGDEDNYDICMECYSLGRSCGCLSKLRWVEQFKWKELVKNHETWRTQIIKFEEHPDISKLPQPFIVEKERLMKKTLAEVCQLELKRRPWVDITKPDIPQEDNEDEVETNDEGRVRKRRKIRRSEKWKKEHGNCHICKTREPRWKLASCSECSLNYCYGSLFRAFEIYPREVMEDPSWKCPKCQKICSCGACRRDPTIKPFEPKLALLAHDTRKVADPRSVESLVDFGQSNITWVTKAGDHPENRIDSRRMRKIVEDAERAKSKPIQLEEDEMDPVEAGILTLARHENIHFDPALATHGVAQNETEIETIPIDPALTSGSYQPSYPQFSMPENAVFSNEVDRYGDTEGIFYEYAPENSTINPADIPLAQESVSAPNIDQPDATTQIHDNNTYPAFGLDGVVELANNAIIQSDLLSAAAPPSSGIAYHKKPRTKRDTDDEFRVRKRRGKKSDAKPGIKRTSVTVTDLDVADDLSEEDQTRSPRNPRPTRKSSRRVSTRQNKSPISIASDENMSPEPNLPINGANQPVENSKVDSITHANPPPPKAQPSTTKRVEKHKPSKINTQLPNKVVSPTRHETEAEKNMRAKLNAASGRVLSDEEGW